MPDSFGARLREQREARHVALAAIADRTKIKLSLLEALEADDVSHWPAGIFRRAYIRSYADAIGLRPDDVVREFNQRFPDPAEPVPTPAEAASATAAATAGSATRLRELMGAAFGSFSRRRLETERPRTVAATEMPAGAVPSDRAGGVIGTPSMAPANDASAVSSDTTAAAVSDAPADRVNAIPPGTANDALTEPANDAVSIVAHESSPNDASAATAASVAAPAIPDRADNHAAPMPAAPGVEPDLSFMAGLCTTLGRLEHAIDIGPLLEDVALLVDAVGLIVWQWDPDIAALRPVLAYGYADAVLAHLPDVRLESCNATAAAFRTGQICGVYGGYGASDALVVPLIVAAGCAGVLAIELPSGGSRWPSTRAVATIVAAQLARLIAGAPQIASLRRLA